MKHHAIAIITAVSGCGHKLASQVHRKCRPRDILKFASDFAYDFNNSVTARDMSQKYKVPITAFIGVEQSLLKYGISHYKNKREMIKAKDAWLRKNKK